MSSKIYRTTSWYDRQKEHLVVHWGMVMAVYPFFQALVETVGCLLRLQGSVAASQVQKRMREQFGKRSTVERATRRTLRIQRE